MNVNIEEAIGPGLTKTETKKSKTMAKPAKRSTLGADISLQRISLISQSYLDSGRELLTFEPQSSSLAK